MEQQQQQAATSKKGNKSKKQQRSAQSKTVNYHATITTNNNKKRKTTYIMDDDVHDDNDDDDNKAPVVTVRRYNLRTNSNNDAKTEEPKDKIKTNDDDDEEDDDDDDDYDDGDNDDDINDDAGDGDDNDESQVNNERLEWLNDGEEEEEEDQEQEQRQRMMRARQSYVKQMVLEKLRNNSLEIINESLSDDTARIIGLALIGNTSVKDLRVYEEHVLSLPAVEILCDGIRQSQIQHLFLSGLTTDDKVRRALFHVIHESQTITKLTVSNDETIDDDVAVCLGEIVLPTSTRLRELVLDGGRLSVEAMRILALGLSQNSSVTTLRFLDTSVDDDCLHELITRYLNHDSCRLEELDLGGYGEIDNDIGPNGAQSLMRAVANLPSIQKLSLSGNVLIGYAGLKLIGNELPNLSLRELDLTFYPSDVNVRNINNDEQQRTKLIMDSARQALLQGMRQNEHIEKLMICNSAFDRDDEREFYAVIHFYTYLNRWRRRFRLVHQQALVPCTIWCYILEKVQTGVDWTSDCDDVGNGPTSLMYYILREQPNMIQSL